MSKVAHYLQEHVVGEVLTSSDARKYFSTDGSIFEITPSVVLYPRNEQDIRKTARFTWQLAERGRIIPMTARGAGTDQTGASIGAGIIMAFTAHMHKIMELDPKSGLVSVQPGINYGKLQQALITHGRFLPPYPASLEYSTIGGAVANNASGERSLKYGDTRGFVRNMRVVLANGEVIETGKLSKRELSRKMGLGTFEGEVYRQVDALIEENKELIESLSYGVSKNATGYAIEKVKTKQGFDLTPLFVGAQGTLGLITETTLEAEPHNPQTTLLVAYIDDTALLEQLMTEVQAMNDKPACIELVNQQLLQFVAHQNANLLTGVLPDPLPGYVLLIEFDDTNGRTQKRLAKKVSKMLSKYQVSFHTETDHEAQEQYRKIRDAASVYITYSEGKRKAVPIIEDGIVPANRFTEYVEKLNELCTKYALKSVLWGHGGDAHLHVMPLIDLSQVGERQKIFKLMDEYYSLLINLGGCPSAQHNDGRLRGPYVKDFFGETYYELFEKLKKIFDPYGTLNPGVKIGVKPEDLRPLLRQEYDLKHWYMHLPVS